MSTRDYDGTDPDRMYEVHGTLNPVSEPPVICGRCGRSVVFVGQEPRHAAYSGDHLPVQVHRIGVVEVPNWHVQDRQEAARQGIWW